MLWWSHSSWHCRYFSLSLMDCWIREFGYRFWFRFRLQTNGYIALYRNFHIAQNQFQIPIETADYKNGIAMGDPKGGGVSGTLGPISFIVMQLSEKLLPNNRFSPPPHGLALPWIRYWFGIEIWSVSGSVNVVTRKWVLDCTRVIDDRKWKIINDTKTFDLQLFFWPDKFFHLKQECIPEGCVPPARYLTGGVSVWGGSP